jgi:hypothetical protein
MPFVYLSTSHSGITFNEKDCIDTFELVRTLPLQNLSFTMKSKMSTLCINKKAQYKNNWKC